jgi:hypothetical protein
MMGAEVDRPLERADQRGEMPGKPLSPDVSPDIPEASSSDSMLQG